MATFKPNAGRYALYKRVTASLVNFLVVTATACRRSATAKGMKRGRVTTPDLKKYAELIDRWRPPPIIPAQMIDLIGAAIYLRTAKSFHYLSRDTPPTAAEAKTDAGHAYFIKVLRDIQTLLQATRARTQEVRKKDRRKDRVDETPPLAITTQDALANVFEALEVEEPCQQDPSAPATRGDKAAGAMPTVVLEVDTEDEKRFELICFLEDQLEIRTFVKDTWDQYHSGEIGISMDVASAVTETAMGVLRRGHEAFTTTYPDLASYDNILACLGHNLVSDGEGGAPELACCKTGTFLNPQSALSLLCPAAAFALGSLQESWRDLNAPPAGHGDNRGIGGTTSTPDSAGASFTQLLQQRSADLLCMVDLKSEFPTEWEKGLQTTATGNVPMHAVSDCQMYMQIHQLFDQGYLEAGCVNNIKTIMRAKKVSRRLEECWTRFFPDGMIVDYACEDPPGLDRLTLYIKSLTHPEPETLPGWATLNVMRSFPAMNAQCQTNCTKEMHLRGLPWLSHGCVTLGLAHLYHAAQRLELVTRWEDMEWILRENPSYVPQFKEELKSGLHRYARQFSFAAGVPLRKFLRMNEQLRDHESPGQKKRLESGSQLIRAEKEQADSDRDFDTREAIALQKLAEKARIEKKAAQAYHSPSHPGIQLLRTFKALRVDDEFRMHFDNISFWFDLEELFEVLRADFNPWATKIAPGLSDGDSFVHALLTDADNFGTKSYTGHFERAAVMIANFVEAKGDKFTRQVAELSRGFDLARL